MAVDREKLLENLKVARVHAIDCGQQKTITWLDEEIERLSRDDEEHRKDYKVGSAMYHVLRLLHDSQDDKTIRRVGKILRELGLGLEVVAP